MQKKCRKIWSYQKKAVLLQPLFKNKGWTESSGAPENFNFWGERSATRSVIERVYREPREC